MQTFIDSSPTLLSREARQVMGCWLGKAVGGTLGMPFEGHDGPLNLRFYEPVPTEMLPNDDLDLQVVWACVLDAMDKPRVDRHVLARAWRDHVQFPWDEYGVALRNMALGLQPPLTGSYDNWFAHGMGATIRSEVWACLAPGDPQLAAAYAYEDACFDHAGEGIHGETFFAALESMAFIESDPDRLLNGALATLPLDSLIRRAVEDTRKWWSQSRDWRAVRELILRDYGHENFTDVTMNVAFTVLGWLAGEGDFSRAICVAVNCGKDTDCTGATVGALMGILDPDCIPEEWLAPIGRDLVLSPGIVGLNPPKTLDEFTELVLRLRQRLAGQAPQPREIDQSADHLKVKAFVSFVPSLPNAEPALMDGARSVDFDGSIGEWPVDRFEDEYLVVTYPFHLKESGTACVMFNTRETCRAWVNGEFLFDRRGGELAPSFHRAPQHQRTDVTLPAGDHWLTAVVRRPKTGSAQWICGIGRAADRQWFPEAIHMAATNGIEKAAVAS